MAPESIKRWMMLEGWFFDLRNEGKNWLLAVVGEPGKSNKSLMPKGMPRKGPLETAVASKNFRSSSSFGIQHIADDGARWRDLYKVRAAWSLPSLRRVNQSEKFMKD